MKLEVVKSCVISALIPWGLSVAYSYCKQQILTKNPLQKLKKKLCGWGGIHRPLPPFPFVRGWVNLKILLRLIFLFFMTETSVRNSYFFMTEISVRLSGSEAPYAGRIKVRYQGVWGTLCEEDWKQRPLIFCADSSGMKALNWI